MGLGEQWGCVEGQDVCLPMSRDSERKRGEWDERGEEGDKKADEGERLMESVSASSLMR